MGLDWDDLHKEDETSAEDFECVICREIASEPQCCNKCSKLFCSPCIEEWLKKNKKCPFKCGTNDMTFKDLTVEKIAEYVKLRFKCNRGCDKFYPLGDYVEHVTICQLPDCSNDCTNKVKFLYNDKETCSYKCYIEATAKDKDEDPSSDLKQGLEDCKGDSTVFEKGFPVLLDFEKASPHFKKTGESSFELNDKTSSLFHTIINKVALRGGVHKFAVNMDNGKFPLKIGITKKKDNEHLDKAFCDYDEGFAFYTLGQTRNGSNASGLLYGERMDHNGKNEVVIELSLGEGKLGFKINGKNFGSAFEEEKLKEGEFYVAVAVRASVKKLSIVPVN